MKLQIYQFEVAEANFKQNKAKISSLIETHYTNADIIVLPEIWNNGYALNQLKDKADIDLQQSLPFIQQLAQQYTTHIVAGSVANMRTNAIYNTAFAVSKDKTLLNVTDKIHLVPMLDEPFYLSPGLIINITRGIVMLAILWLLTLTEKFLLKLVIQKWFLK